MNTNVLESVLPLSNMLLSRINFWGFLPYILLWLQNKNMPPAPYFKFFCLFLTDISLFLYLLKNERRLFLLPEALPDHTHMTPPSVSSDMLWTSFSLHLCRSTNKHKTEWFFSWKIVSCLRAFHVFSVSYLQPPALCVALSTQKYCSS